MRLITIPTLARLRYHWQKRLIIGLFYYQWKDLYNGIRTKAEHTVQYTKRTVWDWARWRGEYEINYIDWSHKSIMIQSSISYNKSKVLSPKEIPMLRKKKKNSGQWISLGIPHKWIFIIIFFLLLPKTGYSSFPDSKIATKMSYGQTKEGILITDVWVPYSIVLGWLVSPKFVSF